MKFTASQKELLAVVTVSSYCYVMPEPQQNDKVLVLLDTRNTPGSNDFLITERHWERRVTTDPQQDNSRVYGLCTEGGNYVHQVSNNFFSERPEQDVTACRRALDIIKRDAKRASRELPPPPMDHAAMRIYQCSLDQLYWIYAGSFQEAVELIYDHVHIESDAETNTLSVQVLTRNEIQNTNYEPEGRQPLPLANYVQSLDRPTLFFNPQATATARTT